MKPAFKFAVCINNADYPASLELHKIYRVLPDEDAATHGDIRVVDESGEVISTQPSISSLWSYQSRLRNPYCELRNLGVSQGVRIRRSPLRAGINPKG